MKIENDLLLTRKEAADLLRIKSATLAKWRSTKIKDAVLPCYKVGSRAMYSRSDIENFLKISKVGGGNEK